MPIEIRSALMYNRPTAAGENGSVMGEKGQITELLARMQRGEPQVESILFSIVYEELRKIASRRMGQERQAHSFQTTDLIHEAYLRLVGGGQQDAWANRAHFFAVAAKIMRHILVDHARNRSSLKRGGEFLRIPLEKAFVYAEDRSEELLAVDEALDRLSRWSERQSRVVEMRFFAGMTVEEISKILDVSVRTVKRDWQLAKSWIRSELDKRGPSDPGAMATN